MQRTVTLIVLDAGGAVLGELPPFVPSHPWWQEVSDIVPFVRERFGLELAVLRLIDSERAQPHGGAVCYLAQLLDAPDEGVLTRASLSLVSAERRRRALEPEPLRAAWALPGGPQASLAWARRELTAQGLGELVRADQQRAWNLSTIWRLSSGAGAEHCTWLKQVPPFFAHEPALLTWLAEHAPRLAPRLVALDDVGRQLLANVPGVDAHGAPGTERARFALVLHDVQQSSIAAAASLLAAGVPDLRGPALVAFVRRWLDASGVERSPAARLYAELERHVAELEAAGLPDTLVHGDFHAGNVRVSGERAVILDWTDAFVGQPVFDLARLCDGASDHDATLLAREWCARWRALYPASDPERAWRIGRPLAALRMAAVYGCFLAQIEPSERGFHDGHLLAELARAGEG